MPLLEDCEKLFGTSKLYDILKISENASTDEIKKGYYKQSLLVHPDKVPEKEKEAATEKFQCLAKVYTILSNAETRNVYDESGEVDNEECIPENREWGSYWRLLFRKITIEDIQAYEKKYKRSDEETTDLREAYFSSKGDMTSILEMIPFAGIDDEERFGEIIREWIKDNQVPDFPAFSDESEESKQERIEMYEEERKEAEKELKKMKTKEKGTESLEAAIMQRQQNRAKQMDGFFDQLAAKYGNVPDSEEEEEEYSAEDEDEEKPKGKKASSSKRGKKAAAAQKKPKNDKGKKESARGAAKRARESSSEEEKQSAAKKKKVATPAKASTSKSPRGAKSAANGKAGKSRAANGTATKRGRKK